MPRGWGDGQMGPEHPHFRRNFRVDRTNNSIINCKGLHLSEKKLFGAGHLLRVAENRPTDMAMN